MSGHYEFDKDCLHVSVGVFIWGHCAHDTCAFVCDIVKYVCVSEELAGFSSVCQIFERCSGAGELSQVGP